MRWLSAATRNAQPLPVASLRRLEQPQFGASAAASSQLPSRDMPHYFNTLMGATSGYGRRGARAARAPSQS